MQGLVKSIGVSNFSRQKIEEILSSCRIRPAVNQVWDCIPNVSVMQGDWLVVWPCNLPFAVALLLAQMGQCVVLRLAGWHMLICSAC